MAEPWPVEARAAKSRKIKKEAERMAAKIGARGVYVIAAFDAGDGMHVHFLDGGTAMPMSPEDLLKMIVSGRKRLDEIGEGYTQ